MPTFNFSVKTSFIGLINVTGSSMLDFLIFGGGVGFAG